MLAPLTLEVLRGVVTPFHVLGICCTIFRLWHRRQKGQLWWDDYWAASALIFDIVFATTPFLREETSNPHQSREMRIIVFWLTALPHPLVAWSARISISMSIARIVPPNTRARHLLYTMSGLFGLMCIAQELHRIIGCTTDTSWHYNTSVQCFLGGGIGLISLIMDLIADTCLVIIPLRMLWRVRLPRTQRRLILSIFAASFVSSAFGIIYTAFVLRKQRDGRRTSVWGMRIGLVSQLKSAMALLVCNLLVIVTYLYCMFWKDEDEGVTEPPETRSKSTQPVPPTCTIVLTEISRMHTTDSASFLFIHTAPGQPSPPMGQLNRRLSQ